MSLEAFIKQAEEPAFRDMLWSKPETKRGSGKLLVIGGNTHAIGGPLKAYDYASKAGIGATRIILPDALRGVTGSSDLQIEFSPRTPSGSFARKALADWVECSSWSDTVLLAGDFGRNSETAVLLESFVAQAEKSVIITKDGIDYIAAAPPDRQSDQLHVLVMNLAQLQKLARSVMPDQAITFSMGLQQLAQSLADISKQLHMCCITQHYEQILCALDGQVSITKMNPSDKIWQLKTASYVAVWLAQQNHKPFEAITTAIWCSANSQKPIADS